MVDFGITSVNVKPYHVHRSIIRVCEMSYIHNHRGATQEYKVVTYNQQSEFMT
jgi:hypothetical protein